MKFGLFANQYYTDDGAFEVTDLYEQADLLEELGFDLFATGERHIHKEGVVEPLTALAAIAGRTDRLELATMAILPAIHDQIMLAEQVAMIDRLSEGRMKFGAAIGYRERELTPFGLSMDDRASAFIESLHLLKRLWSEESVTHDGDFFSYDDVFVSPRPADGMPVWIGGHADIAIKRAAYRGDAWIASASSKTKDLKHQIGVYEDSLDEFGMDRADNQIVLMRDCYVADSVEEARDVIEPHLLELYKRLARRVRRETAHVRGTGRRPGRHPLSVPRPVAGGHRDVPRTVRYRGHPGVELTMTVTPETGRTGNASDAIHPCQ